MTDDKLDLFKANKEQYRAGKRPILVEIPSAVYLSIDGQGAPGSADYVAAIGALYGMAYTVKMTRKVSGRGDYVIGKLEAQTWIEGDGDLDQAPIEAWSWRLMIRTPEVVDEADLDDARTKLTDKGKGAGVDRVTLIEIAQGRCVQMLHVGPYDREPETVAVMLDFAAAEGLRRKGRHHEIYLSDPRRVPPEKLRTIVRIPVAPA